jgi:hypothetical protein
MKEWYCILLWKKSSGSSSERPFCRNHISSNSCNLSASHFAMRKCRRSASSRWLQSREYKTLEFGGSRVHQLRGRPINFVGAICAMWTNINGLRRAREPY